MIDTDEAAVKLAGRSHSGSFVATMQLSVPAHCGRRRRYLRNTQNNVVPCECGQSVWDLSLEECFALNTWLSDIWHGLAAGVV